MTTPAARAALNWLNTHAPQPSDAHETVALAIHALLLYHDFRPSSALPDEAGAGLETNESNLNSENGSDTVGNVPAVLPQGWGGAGYGGEYRHVRSAMTFDIRGVRMGRRLVVHAAAGEDDSRMYTVDVRVDEFVAQGNAVPSNSTEQNDGGSEVWCDLTRIDDLATLVAVQIAHRLVPDGAKHGYEDGVDVGDSAANAAASASGQPQSGNEAEGSGRMPIDYDPSPLRVERDDDPLRIGPRRQPGFPRFPGPPGMPGMPGFGRDDMIHPDLDPGIGGRGFFGPGGNLMGPGHFVPGGGRLPPGVPPGARFDPYGPTPDRDIERPPGFEDEHGLNGPPMGGTGLGGPLRGGNRRGTGGDGPPPGMFF